MKKATDKRIKPEMLTRDELLIIRAGGSPWPNTTAPKKPSGELKKKRIAV